MTQGDYFILMGVGGFFIVLGLVTFLLGKREQKSYFDYAATRTKDLREFVQGGTEEPQAGALKIGGWISIALGLLMLAVGVALWIWGGASA